MHEAFRAFPAVISQVSPSTKVIQSPGPWAPYLWADALAGLPTGGVRAWVNTDKLYRNKRLDACILDVSVPPGGLDGPGLYSTREVSLYCERRQTDCLKVPCRPSRSCLDSALFQ